MISDEERREVALNMRDGVKSKTEFELLSLNGSSSAIRWLISYVVFGDKKYHSGADLMNRLADLIEPSGHECVPGECPLNVRHDNDRIDQERLLAIATIMAADSVRSAKQGSSVSPVYILHAARNIAEACGETFGSIRNRELAKWGTSIVPKETIVDRDALLALADEMNDACPESASVAIGYIDDYARRIREACGEGVRNG